MGSTRIAHDHDTIGVHRPGQNTTVIKHESTEHTNESCQGLHGCCYHGVTHADKVPGLEIHVYTFAKPI